jgi:hypothetical protein
MYVVLWSVPFEGKHTRTLTVALKPSSRVRSVLVVGVVYFDTMSAAVLVSSRFQSQFYEPWPNVRIKQAI